MTVLASVCASVCSSFEKAPTFLGYPFLCHPPASTLLPFYHYLVDTPVISNTRSAKMVVDYEKQALELYGLYNMETESGQAQCIEQAQDNLRDLAMPPHWRTWSLAFLVVFEDPNVRYRRDTTSVWFGRKKTTIVVCFGRKKTMITVGFGRKKIMIVVSWRQRKIMIITCLSYSRSVRRLEEKTNLQSDCEKR
jgi:hypothetical protein